MNKQNIKQDGNKKETNNQKVSAKKSLKNGSYSAVLTVIVIAVIVVINLAVNAISSKYTMIDVSTQKLYTIGDETKKSLDDLDQDVTVYYLTDNSSEDSTITMLLDNYKSYSDHIEIVKKGKNSNIVATKKGIDFLFIVKKNDEWITQSEFTKQMESALDEISQGKVSDLNYIKLIH